MCGCSGRGSGDEAANNASLVSLIRLGKRKVLTLKLTELCVKSLRRQLEAMSDNPAELDALGYRDMIRVGVERGFIIEEADWFRYRELRNTTAHVYDPAKAAQVFAELPLFLQDAEALLGKLMAAST